MAAGQSHYTHGEMEVTGHKKTFGGFMGVTVYGGSALICILLMPTLVFGVGLAWLPSLIATVIVGIIIGLVLKLKGGWYAGLIAGAVLVGIISVIGSIIMSTLA